MQCMRTAYRGGKEGRGRDGWSDHGRVLENVSCSSRRWLQISETRRVRTHNTPRHARQQLRYGRERRGQASCTVACASACARGQSVSRTLHNAARLGCRRTASAQLVVCTCKKCYNTSLLLQELRMAHHESMISQKVFSLPLSESLKPRSAESLIIACIFACDNGS
jgi:hypothetical protein